MPCSGRRIVRPLEKLWRPCLAEETGVLGRWKIYGASRRLGFLALEFRGDEHVDPALLQVSDLLPNLTPTPP